MYMYKWLETSAGKMPHWTICRLCMQDPWVLSTVVVIHMPESRQELIFRWEMAEKCCSRGLENLCGFNLWVYICHLSTKSAFLGVGQCVEESMGPSILQELLCFRELLKSKPRTDWPAGV